VLADTECHIARHGVGIDMSAKQSIPDGKQGRQVVAVVPRVITVVNVMVAGRGNEPLHPSRAPAHVEVHPIVLKGVFETDRDGHPPGRKPNHALGEYVGQVDQDLLKVATSRGGTSPRCVSSAGHLRDPWP